jgi:hypothetical protein
MLDRVVSLSIKGSEKGFVTSWGSSARAVRLVNSILRFFIRIVMLLIEAVDYQIKNPVKKISR